MLPDIVLFKSVTVPLIFNIPLPAVPVFPDMVTLVNVAVEADPLLVKPPLLLPETVELVSVIFPVFSIPPSELCETVTSVRFAVPSFLMPFPARLLETVLLVTVRRSLVVDTGGDTNNRCRY